MDSLNDLIWTDEDLENEVSSCAEVGAMVQICMIASCGIVMQNKGPHLEAPYYGVYC